MNILVTWVVIVWATIACPDFTQDPYTGEIDTYHNKTCIPNEGHYVEKKMSKEFTSMVEAMYFIDDSPEDYDFKIEILEDK